MKGDKYLRLAVVVLLCAVASYLIFSVVRGAGGGYTTYKAVLCEVGDGISTSGFVVRDEKVLYSKGNDIVVLTRAEGERVGKDMAVASTFRDENARARQEEIDRLTVELSQMKQAAAFSATDAESATLESDIQRLMAQVNAAASRRDYATASSLAGELRTSALRRYLTRAESETLNQRIAAAEEKMAALESQAAAESGTITVDEPGYFSATADGYEAVLNSDYIMIATIEELDKLMSKSRPLVGAIGKLVTSPRWYYACVVDADSVLTLKEGNFLNVNFAYDIEGTIRMQIARIGGDEGDTQKLLVLTTDRYLQYAVTSRRQSAEIVFEDISGLRVPKGGIYVDENGQSGVYVLEGAEARWKPVEVLYESGESFVVTLDQSSTGNLWPGDEIILTTEELYEGKVMIQ